MGLFDDLICEYPLPGNPPKTAKYQTKSLGCDLYEYRITSDGTLCVHNCDYEDRSDPTAAGYERLKGRAVRVNERWEQVTPPFRGEVFFYGESGDYSALFDDGKLLNVKLVASDESEATNDAT